MASRQVCAIPAEIRLEPRGHLNSNHAFGSHMTAEELYRASTSEIVIPTYRRFHSLSSSARGCSVAHDPEVAQHPRRSAIDLQYRGVYSSKFSRLYTLAYRIGDLRHR